MVAQLIAGRYQVLEQVAVLSRATTYRAVDRETGELVAVRLVDQSLAADPRFVAHFHRQAHVAAELVHPNVSRLLDYGRSDSTYFLVLEWVEGSTLDHYLAARGPLPVADALAIAAPVSAALAAAHGAGLIHGGVNPEDVIVRADGVVKVSDFGLAKPPGMLVRPETTESRAVAYYVSPEQAQGEAPTPASDVYALGALLFRMLAGRPPFEGATPLAIALKHVNEDPPGLQALRPDVPPDVAALVMRALAKPPARRFRNGAEMERAIQSLPAYRPGWLPLPLVPPPPPSLFRRLITPPVSWLAGIFLFLLILTLGGVLLVMAGAAVRQSPAPTATTPPSLAPALVGRPLSEAEQIAAQRNLRLDVSERPDSRIPRDIVLEQSPAADQPVAPAGVIRVVVSQGPPEVEVPNLTGLDIGQARASLERARLRPGSTSQRVSAPESRGQVLEQYPPPGARVPEGSAVDLIVGAGPLATQTPSLATPTVPPAATPTAPVVLPPVQTSSPTPLPASPTATPTPALPTPSPIAPSPTATALPATPTPVPPTATGVASPSATPTAPKPSPTVASPTPTPSPPPALPATSPAPGG